MIGGLGLLLGLTPLLYSATRGFDLIGAVGGSTSGGGALNYAFWLCVEQRLHQLVPAGSHVWVKPTDNVEWSQRLHEISAPELVVVAASEPGAYAVSLVPGTGSETSDCGTVRLVAEVVR